MDSPIIKAEDDIEDVPLSKDDNQLKSAGANACCHYCRISINRERKRPATYIKCSTCKKQYCSRCLTRETHIGIGVDAAKEPNWTCACCRQDCCCCFAECPTDHVHCFTYKRTLSRHSLGDYKWVKSKKHYPGFESDEDYSHEESDTEVELVNLRKDAATVLTRSALKRVREEGQGSDEPNKRFKFGSASSSPSSSSTSSPTSSSCFSSDDIETDEESSKSDSTPIKKEPASIKKSARVEAPRKPRGQPKHLFPLDIAEPSVDTQIHQLKAKMESKVKIYFGNGSRDAPREVTRDEAPTPMELEPKPSNIQTYSSPLVSPLASPLISPLASPLSSPSKSFNTQSSSGFLTPPLSSFHSHEDESPRGISRSPHGAYFAQGFPQRRISTVAHSPIRKTSPIENGQELITKIAQRAPETDMKTLLSLPPNDLQNSVKRQTVPKASTPTASRRATSNAIRELRNSVNEAMHSKSTHQLRASTSYGLREPTKRTSMETLPSIRQRNLLPHDSIKSLQSLTPNSEDSQKTLPLEPFSNVQRSSVAIQDSNKKTTLIGSPLSSSTAKDAIKKTNSLESFLPNSVRDSIKKTTSMESFLNGQRNSVGGDSVKKTSSVKRTNSNLETVQQTTKMEIIEEPLTLNRSGTSNTFGSGDVSPKLRNSPLSCAPPKSAAYPIAPRASFQSFGFGKPNINERIQAVAELNKISSPIKVCPSLAVFSEAPRAPQSVVTTPNPHPTIPNIKLNDIPEAIAELKKISTSVDSFAPQSKKPRVDSAPLSPVLEATVVPATPTAFVALTIDIELLNSIRRSEEFNEKVKNLNPPSTPRGPTPSAMEKENFSRRPTRIAKEKAKDALRTRKQSISTSTTPLTPFAPTKLKAAPNAPLKPSLKRSLELYEVPVSPSKLFKRNHQNNSKRLEEYTRILGSSRDNVDPAEERELEEILADLKLSNNDVVVASVVPNQTLPRGAPRVVQPKPFLFHMLKNDDQKMDIEFMEPFKLPSMEEWTKLLQLRWNTI